MDYIITTIYLYIIGESDLIVETTTNTSIWWTICEDVRTNLKVFALTPQ